MKKFEDLTKMWNAFKTFKRQVPSMNYDDVMKELGEFKECVDNMYNVEQYRQNHKNKMDDEIAKILNVKKNLVTNNQEIMGWKMPASFIPYVEKGEEPEMLPKRAYDAYKSMLTNSEFNMLCMTNWLYMAEYDKFIVNWLAKAYNLDKAIVQHNLNKVVALLLKEYGIEKDEFKSLAEDNETKVEKIKTNIPEDKVKEVEEWFSKRTLYGSWEVFTCYNPTIHKLGVDMLILQDYYNELTKYKYAN